MVSYGLVDEKASGSKGNRNRLPPAYPTSTSASSSAQHTPSSSAAAKPASLSQGKTKIPLIYSSPVKSPSPMTSFSFSSTFSTSPAYQSKTATTGKTLQSKSNENSASSSPCKALEMVSDEVAKRQAHFHSVLQEKRSQTLQISRDFQHHDRQMQDSIAATLLELERLDLEEIKKQQLKNEQEAKRIERQEKEEQLRRDQEAAKAQKDKELKEAKEQEAKEKAIEKKSKADAEAAAEKAKQVATMTADRATPATTAGPVTPVGNNGHQQPPPPQIVSEAAFAAASKCLDRVTLIKTSIKPTILSNPASANQIMAGKMLINRSVGQLTRSVNQLVPLVKKFVELFTAAQSRSQEEYELVMYLAAKKIVKQAEMEVSVKQDSAFPLGILSVNISTKHPAFQEVLLGRMMKKCPYIVPMYPRKQPNESLKEYQKRLGYNVKKEPVETEIQYGERMCGIISLYAAIVQTDLIPNSYGIENGWTWLARILNMRPRKITPLIIYSFLNVAGHKLVQQYKDQALKLVAVLCDSLIPIFPKAAVASATKLALYLDETVKKTGTFPPHSGHKMER